MQKAIKAIILSRVSSKDQEDGYSLEVQTDRLEKYCDRRGLHIIKRYQIVESSTKGDRKQFMEIIKFIKSQREPIAFVADKVDRIQRSQKETPILDDMIRQGKLELHFNSESYIIHQESSAHELMMWGMGVVVAKSHTDLLSENVKKSLKRKVEAHGEWYGSAPIGYLNQRDQRGRGIIVTDPISASIVTKLFAEFATGVYTLSQMVTKAKEWGLRSKKGGYVNKSVLHRMFRNPFYYGQMRFKGELWTHNYERLTTIETFKKCEATLMGWKKKPFQYRGKEFLFRGLLTCKTTGKLVLSDTKVKKYPSRKKSEWTYLIAYDPKNSKKKIWVREDKVIKQLEEVLKNLAIKDEKILKQTMEYLTAVNEGKKHDFNREVGALKQEHANIQNKLDKLLDLLAEGVLTKEEFLTKKNKYKERQHELTELLQTYDKIDDKFSKKLLEVINITNEVYDTFKGSKISEKRQLLKFMFSNLFLGQRSARVQLDFSISSELAKLTNCVLPER
ncbi:MAG: recombinase family protein [Rickettsiaceae bacterium]|nr:recombinase family protein [Rickettsiaceae bacterium]